MNRVSTTLGDICAAGGGGIQTGPFGSQLHASDYSISGTPVVMPQDIGDNILSSANVARVDADHVERLRRHKLVPGNIVYSRRGDVERRALVRSENDGWLCGTGCLRVSFGVSPVADPEFVSYHLGLDTTRGWIVRHAVGATMLNLNTSILANVPLQMPELHEQRAIAEVLGALDDKVAANAKLASIADELVRSMYARFRSAGETKTIGDLARHPRDLVDPSRSLTTARYVGLEHVPRRSMWLDGSGTAETVTSTKAAFARGDVLFGKLRPYFHKVVSAPSDGICSTDILVLRPLDVELSGFLLAAAASDYTVQRCTASSEGTRMPRASWKDLAAVCVPWPGLHEAQSFSQTVDAIRVRIEAAICESVALAETRDALLPLLMSGKIRVKDAEGVVEGVV